MRCVKLSALEVSLLARNADPVTMRRDARAEVCTMVESL